DRRLITGLRLKEISLVDRPANPEAVFDCWKRAAAAADDVDYADPGYQPDGAKRYPFEGPPAEHAAMEVAAGLKKLIGADLAALADTLAKLAGDIVPRLDALQKRVDDIAQTPLPPQTA